MKSPPQIAYTPEIVIQAMLSPETYPEPPQTITHIQTHISHIFLTGGLVYKIKKPVDFGFLDFTTLAKRRYYCQQEVRLNRRLTRGLYLGVVKIAFESGKPVINGKGPVLEYAVLMREMPQERMMNRLLAAGEVREKDIRALVRTLLPFYRKAQTGKGVNHFGQIEVIAKNTEENFVQTRPYVDHLINSRTFDHIISGTRDFLLKEKNLFRRRLQEGHIRDCHGDLHSANICLDKKIQIYDCIEFNHRFRYSDIACDLAFLAMDLDFHTRPDLSELLIRDFVRLSGDQELPRLLTFYKSYRAYVRAKIHSFTSESPELSPKEKKEESRLAKRYYHLAFHYIQSIQEDHSPRLVVVLGLMGTGKTSLAKELSKRTGWALFSSDETRKTLVGISPTSRKWEPFGKGIYSESISRKMYRKVRDEAEKRLKQGQSVILDGSYKRQAERLVLLDLAHRTGARIRFIECRAPMKTIQRRLDHRSRDAQAVSDGRWALFQQQRSDFDPIVDPIKSNCLQVRTDGPIEKEVEKILLELAHSETVTEHPPTK
jgi:uncharacterized protein